jgi:hypothetical protein
MTAAHCEFSAAVAPRVTTIGCPAILVAFVSDAEHATAGCQRDSAKRLMPDSEGQNQTTPGDGEDTVESSHLKHVDAYSCAPVIDVVQAGEAPYDKRGDLHRRSTLVTAPRPCCTIGTRTLTK